MKKIIWFSLLSVLLAGLIIAPETPRIPVSAATPADWNPHSFWYYPWGKSGVHKGIDIFAKKGQPVLVSTSGWVVSKGYDELGGNYALVWSWQARLHYYAHLDTVNTCEHCWIKQGASIGTVGDSGNAKGKPTHLHYAIYSAYPQIWLYDANLPQASSRLFYVDPHRFLMSR